MSNPFSNLDKLLEHSARLHIMSVLAVNESYDFTSLRDLLNVTDGSLATHIKALEKEQYITVSKAFIDRKPSTRYSISDKGRTSFKNHIDALDALVQLQRKS